MQIKRIEKQQGIPLEKLKIEQPFGYLGRVFVKTDRYNANGHVICMDIKTHITAVISPLHLVPPCYLAPLQEITKEEYDRLEANDADQKTER